MSRSQQRKGAEGERELTDLLLAHGVDAARHGQEQRYTGAKGLPDVAATIGGRRMHIECKRVERLNIPKAYAQSAGDAAEGYTPIVAHRQNRRPWLVTMSLMDFLTLFSDGGAREK